MRRLALLIVLFGVSASLVAQEISVSAGYRVDYLTWNIGWEGCNVGSELAWRSQAVEVVVGTSYRCCPRIFFECEAGVGVVVEGRDRDSDYQFDDRVGEFSRSYSEVRGWLIDGSLDLAVVSAQIDPVWCVLVGRVGLEGNFQRFVSRHGLQVIAETQDGFVTGEWPFSCDGVNAIYNALWLGPWVGQEARWRVGSCAHLRAGARLYGGLFAGEGDWKLRDDLKAFYDVAAFLGLQGRLRWEWPLSARSVVWVSLLGSWRRAARGIHLTHRSDGKWGRCHLNGVQWLNLTAQIGLRW